MDRTLSGRGMLTSAAIVGLAVFGQGVAGAEPPRIWGEAVCVALSADGRRVAAAYLGVDHSIGSQATEPPTIFVWDTAGGPPIARISGHTEPVTAICLSPDGRTLVSGDMGYDIRAWDVATSKERGRIGRSGSVALSLAFAPTGNMAAVTTGDGVIVADLTAGEPKRLTMLETPRGNRPDENDRTVSVAFSSDGKRFAAVTQSWLYLWDVEAAEFTGRRRAKEPNQWSFSCIGFLPDGKHAVTCDSNGTNFILWDLAGPEPKPLTGVPRVDAESRAEPTSITGFPDGRRFLADTHKVTKSRPFSIDGVDRPLIAAAEGTVTVREVAGGKQLWEVNAYCGSLSHDGKTLATTGDGNRREQVVLWDTTGPELREKLVLSPPAAR